MKPGFLVFLLPLLCAWGQDSSSPRTARAIGGRALAQQLDHEQTDDRIRDYEKLLAKSPDSFALKAGLVSAYLQKLREAGDRTYLDRASKLVDSILEKDGGNFAALRFQNEIDLQRHDFKAVVDRSQDMAKYAPSDPGTWGNLGDASMELGEYEQANKAYLRMFSLRPNLASYNRLAYLHFVTGDGVGALALMREAVEAGDPQPENVAWCWAELGDMEFKLGKLADASEAYQTALSLFPTLHRASAGLGKVQAAQGQIPAAIKSYQRAQSIVPMIDYAAALEDLYAASGDKKRAHEQEELLNAIETLGKANNETTNRNLALILADHNRDLNVALELMRTEIPTRPDVYTWDALSWALFKSGHLDEARTASAKALKLNTPEPVFYYHASKIALAAGDEKSARDYSDRLTSLNAKFDFFKTEMASAKVP